MEVLLGSTKMRGTATWDGVAWSPVKPTANYDVVLKAAFDTALHGGFVCHNLTIPVASGLTIAKGTKVTVCGSQVTQHSSTLITVNDADFVLLNKNPNVSQVKITLNRTIPGLQRLDYYFLGSPISGVVVKTLSPNTTNTRFYQYNTTAFSSRDPLTSILEAGRGWQIRVPTDFPEAVSDWLITHSNTSGGTLNAGVIKKSFANWNSDFVHVCNPYAGTLDYRKFWERNQKYLKIVASQWVYTNGSGGNAYAPTNLNCATKKHVSEKFLPFQAMLVELKDRTATNEIVFTPDMQILHNNYSVPDRLQIALYKVGINLPIDAAVFDVKRFDERFISYAGSLYFGFKVATENRTIHQDSYTPGMVLPLFVKPQSSGNHTISLESFSGIFETTKVMLKDAAGALHDLKTTGFTFAGVAATTYNFSLLIT